MHSFSAAPMEEFDVHELNEISPVSAFSPPTESTISFELADTSQAPALDVPVIDEVVIDDVTADEVAAAIDPMEVELQPIVMATKSEIPAPVIVAPPVHSALPPGREQLTQERGEVARVDADLLDNHTQQCRRS